MAENPYLDFIRDDLNKMLAEELKRSIFEEGEKPIYFGVDPARSPSDEKLWERVNPKLVGWGSFVNDFLNYNEEDVNLTMKEYQEKGTEMTDKKPELILEDHTIGAVDPDSHAKALAYAKRNAGKYGVLSVTGDGAGYIESYVAPYEEPVRDDAYYLSRMEEILEKAEEDLAFDNRAMREVDKDYVRGSNGNYILFEMYAEVLHARLAVNTNQDFSPVSEVHDEEG